MKAVILCGGSGTRLWPISRNSSPKQFFKLFGDKSLFELTIERNKNLVEEFIFVVNKAQVNICQKQIPSDIKFKIIVESAARNTAPAIALAALTSKDSELLILPSDHLIPDQALYEQSIKQAREFKGGLVTFGITPTYPETGYGYIQADGFQVEAFKEKPKLETAKKYLAAGNYFWNSGMFFFESQTYLTELEKFCPDIKQACLNAFKDKREEGDVIDIPKELMLKIPKESIDYAVMEKSQLVKVIPTQFSWNDLGSFDSLYDVKEKDSQGNSGENTLVVNAKNNLVLGNKRLVALANIDDLIIVDTADALLITKRGTSQDVKKVYEQVKNLDPKKLD